MCVNASHGPNGSWRSLFALLMGAPLPVVQRLHDWRRVAGGTCARPEWGVVYSAVIGLWSRPWD
eukprot:10448867-Prorocentrum_lima.AAC.1